MSDTPRTDAVPHNVAELGVFARKLERELAAAQDRIAELTITSNKHAADALAARSDVAYLRSAREALNERVAELEEQVPRHSQLEDAGASLCLAAAAVTVTRMIIDGKEQCLDNGLDLDLRNAVVYERSQGDDITAEHICRLNDAIRQWKGVAK